MAAARIGLVSEVVHDFSIRGAKEVTASHRVEYSHEFERGFLFHKVDRGFPFHESDGGCLFHEFSSYSINDLVQSHRPFRMPAIFLH